MKLSVIVPAYNAQKELPTLLDSLANQKCEDFEVIVVDDGSQDNTSGIVGSFGCTLVCLKKNHGPAACRNIGAKEATGDILVFTDSDCRVESDWAERVEARFLENDIAAIMGKVELMPSTLLGNSISALGFPAGGSIGFDKIWRVDEKGFTDSLSTCNCAIKKDVFEEIGGFDESFPFPGGEDTLLAYKLRKYNYGIRYCPDIVVYHDARDSFKNFLIWQFRRGISSFIFSKKVSDKSRYLSLRIWSTGNIVRTYCTHRIFPLVLFLLGVSISIQFIGVFYAKSRENSICTS